MLPRVIRSLLEKAAAARAKTNLDPSAPPPRAYYCHTKYRYELRDIEFYAEMRACGLEMKEVREPGMSTPPASPEPLSQLFPRSAWRCIASRWRMRVDSLIREPPMSLIRTAFARCCSLPHVTNLPLGVATRAGSNSESSLRPLEEERDGSVAAPSAGSALLTMASITAANGRPSARKYARRFEPCLRIPRLGST